MIIQCIDTYIYNHIKYWCTWLLLTHYQTMKRELRDNAILRKRITHNIETIEDILYKRSGYAD